MLKFIGTGSAFNTDMINNSAFIKEETTLFIIDSGETAFARMKNLKLFDDIENVYIAITHTHSDHIGSLGSLVAYLNIFCNIVPTFVITNEDSAEVQENTIREYLRINGIEEDEYDFSYGDMMEDVLTGLKKVEMVEINHSKKLTSYAIELHFQDKTIYYTGDHNDKEYISEIASKLKPQDIVYTDCTNKDYENRPHITINELAEIFSENQREQVYCMHLENMAICADIKQAGFKVASGEKTIEELLKLIANRK